MRRIVRGTGKIKACQRLERMASRMYSIFAMFASTSSDIDVALLEFSKMSFQGGLMCSAVLAAQC